MIFPEAFDALANALPPELRPDVRAGYYRQLMSPDPAIHGPAATALCHFSAATVNVVPNPATLDSYRDLNVALPLARLFLHYNSNDYFLPQGQLLRDLHRIRHLPCQIISGRYDVTTPVESAWALHKAWPGSTIRILKDAAHGWSDESFARAILAAHEAMKAW
jgi:proline iminopeptidase